MVTLADLLGERADGDPVDPAGIAAHVAASRRVLVVLDDDPTGTQSVAELPVLLRWEVEDLRWALTRGAPAVYVLTNSRSLDPADADRRNREVARHALAAAADLDVSLTFVSRSDSTLRGHFPLETDVLADELVAAGQPAVDAVLLVPAFGDAGRITVAGVHYAGSAEAGYVPVGESEFAADATFGYRSSDLREWVAEKSAGRWAAADVGLLDLATLRGPAAGATAVLTAARGGVPIAVDIVTENDLRRLAVAVLTAQDAGARLLVRCGPPFPRALVGQPPRAPLTGTEVDTVRADQARTASVGGLVVVGSHTALTTSQLAALTDRRCPLRFDLDVARLTALTTADPDTDTDTYLDELTDTVAAGLERGDVVLATSRTLVRADSAEESLAIARRVSAAVVAVVGGVLARRAPRFVVAKGGITASDVAAQGLQITRAVVRGPLLPGLVSLWAPVDGPARGLPYVVFAGNVGGPESLADVVDTLSAEQEETR